MEEKLLKDYLIDQNINIDKVIEDYYNYIYTVVKNSVNFVITDEDIEEIISDVFVALWKNAKQLSNTTNIKAYLIGTARNVIKNKYRKSEINIPISDYEEKIIASYNLEETIENSLQEKEIQKILKSLKEIESNVFILYYYYSKSIKEISDILKISKSNTKVILHRVRKNIKKKLNKGGYGYGE